MISHPDIVIQSNEAEPAMSAADRVNVRRVMQHMQRNIQAAACNCVGLPNTEESKELIRQQISQQLQRYAGCLNLNGYQVQVDPRSTLPRDMLAEESDSVEEYRMKKAIAEGVVPDVTEKQFELMHDPNAINDLNVSVAIQPAKAVQYVKLNFNVSVDLDASAEKAES